MRYNLQMRLTLRTRDLRSMGAALTLFLSEALGATPVHRLLSPQGKFEVDVGRPTVAAVSTAYSSPSAGGTAPNIIFYMAGTDRVVAQGSWTGPSQGLPDLARQILWSPEEDFAILPRGGETRMVVFTRFPWPNTTFPLDDHPLVWLDALHVIGNWSEGCKQTVAEFDGSKIRTTSIVNAGEPYGYHIVSASPTRIVLEKMATRCATPEQRRSMVPECMTLALPSLQREIVACPKA